MLDWRRLRVVALTVFLSIIACTSPAGAPGRDRGSGASSEAPRVEKRVVYGVTQPIDVRPNAQTSGRNWILALTKVEPLT